MAKNKGGRPKIQIDKDEFEKLCALHCTLDEMAGFFDCSQDTIESWCKSTYKKGFSDISRLKRGKGKISLRRAQWVNAMKGNTALLIFLGKQYLGQVEKQEVDITTRPTMTFVATDGSSLVFGHEPKKEEKK